MSNSTARSRHPGPHHRGIRRRRRSEGLRTIAEAFSEGDEQEERSLELAQSWLGDTGRWLKATCSRSQGLQCVTLTFCHDAALQTLRSYSILTCEPVFCGGAFHDVAFTRVDGCDVVKGCTTES